MLRPLSALLGIFSADLGIDLGTANTLVYVRGRGVTVNEPSIVAVDLRNDRTLAVGKSAKEMVGRTPENIVAHQPLRNGVIADFDVVEQMLRYFIGRVHSDSPLVPRPRVIVGIPSGVTEVEKRAVHEATLQAGAREAYLIQEPMAAAIGASLPIQEAVGTIIVDIGGGTTEVAVIALGGVAVSNSVRIAGTELDQAIVDYVRSEHGLLIGERTAEACKIQVGSTRPFEDEGSTTVRGRDVYTRLPRSMEITSGQVREAINPIVAKIVNCVIVALESTPPELLSDIMQSGICLAGGGALLRGIESSVANAAEIPAFIAEKPLEAVVTGTGICLENVDRYRDIFVADEALAF